MEFNEPVIKSLQWIPKVPYKEKNKYLNDARKYYKDFKFTEYENGKLVTIKNRDYYFPTYYIEQYTNDRVVFGIDLSTDALKWHAMHLAATTGSIVATAPLNLNQNSSSKTLIFKAVFNNGAKVIKSTQELENLKGFILAILDNEQLVKSSLSIDPMKDINLHIVDKKSEEHTIYGKPMDSPYYSATRDLNIGGRTWQIDFSIAPINVSRPWHIWGLLIVGALFTGILGAFLQLITGRIETVKHLVELKTIELNHTNKQLTEANEQAILANETKSLFVSNISHEIRTPLTSIIGTSEILTKEAHSLDTAKIEEMAAKILSNSSHLLDLINDILDFSKIEANKLDIENIPFNLTKSITEVEEMFSSMAKAKQISFNLVKQVEVPDVINGDETRLKQILINLLSNAIKFTDKDGFVTLSISYNVLNKNISFKVSDSGVGIPEDKIAKLFNAFSQVDNSVTRKYGGTGLGLAISSQLCQLMGGDLVCNSEVGVGSSFIATIKVDKADKDVKIEKIKSTNLDFVPEELKTKKVLVAEDWQDNQELISWHLNNIGVDFKIVENGIDAVTEGKSNEYDLILMDIQMPKLDGVNATQQLRQLGCNTVIVALSANVMKEQINEYFEVGFDDFLAKPFKEDEFKKTIYTNLKLGDKIPEETSSFEDSEDFLQIKNNFIESIPGYINEIKQAQENNNIDDILRFAHSIKSCAKTFHFHDLAECAEKIELYMRENNNFIDKDLDKFYLELEKAYKISPSP